MNVRDPRFTARLEDALRLLAKQPTRPLVYLTSRFGLESGDLATWLAEFNGGSKTLGPDRIERVKAELGAMKVTRIENAPPVAAQDSARNAPPAASIEAPPSSAKLHAPTSDIGRWLEQQRAKITARVNCFQVEVTPEMASGWLGFNTGNRNPSKQKIRRFAASMKAGRWTLNGETVKFSVTGRLLDGQSRLLAIQLAEVPIVLEVRAGLPDIAQQSMDAGELRKGAHTLEMLGENNPGLLASSLKLVWLLEKDQLAGNKFGVSAVLENYEVPLALVRHPDLRKSVGWVVSEGHKVQRTLRQSEAAFFHYLFGAVDAELRDAFFDALVEGVGLTKASPVYHLREKLLGGEIVRDGSTNARVRRALVIKAWNHARAGEKINMLRFSNTEDFPSIDGLDLTALSGKGGAS